MKTILCKFCRKNGEKAKEHIWPKWLQKELTGDTKSKYIGCHLACEGLLGMHSKRIQSGKSLTFGNICSTCNNGWMSKIENNFKYLFKEIRKDYQKIYHLNKQERKIISVWGLKTAMMINSGTNYRQIIPNNHYVNLCTNQQIPKNTKIDIGFIGSKEVLSWEQSNISHVSGTNESMINYFYEKIRKKTYVLTMQLEHLGIKIIYCKNCKTDGHTILKSDQNKSLRIWPFIKNGKASIKNTYRSIESMNFDTQISLQNNIKTGTFTPPSGFVIKIGNAPIS